MKTTEEKVPLKEKVTDSEVWQSVFRHGYPDTDRNRALTVFSNFFLHWHPVKVRKSGLKMTYTFCLGGVSFLLFLILAITGALLMVYYVPDTDQAYANMKDLQYVVFFGHFFRDIHRWAAHGMVLCVILHMARVFYTGSYKPPRQFNWVVGVSLLVLTLLLSFTGYLLPWDQLAYWAVTVGTNMAKAAPFLGAEGPFHNVLGMTETNDMRFLLLGGTDIGQSALIRFYVLHCFVLPVGALSLMAIHFWRIRKDGGISGPL